MISSKNDTDNDKVVNDLIALTKWLSKDHITLFNLSRNMGQHKNLNEVIALAYLVGRNDGKKDK